MAESQYTGITVQGLYNDVTGDALFGVNGTTAPASSVLIAGIDANTGFSQALSVGPNGFLNVNATITPPSDNTSTGSITSTQNVSVSTTGTSALMVQVEGTWTGTLDFEVTLDGTNWQAALLYPVFPDGAPAVSAVTANGNWTLSVGGVRSFRVRGNTVATGSATIFLTAGQGQYGVVATSPVAANFNATVVGTKTNNAAASNGTNIATLPAIATTAAPTYTTGNVVALSTDTAGNLRTLATQNGAWTVSATQGTSPWVDNLTQVAGVALGATAVTAFGTAPAAANVPGTNSSIFAGTTGITATGTSLNVNVTNTVTVTGTVAVTQSTSPWVVAGNLTNNNAAPAANNVGVLGFLANAANPTYTEGDQVLGSVDLSGHLRVVANQGTSPWVDNLTQVAGVALGATPVTAFGTAPAAANVPGTNSSIYAGTTGLTATGTSLNVNITGSSTLTIAGNLTNNNAAPAANNLGVLGFVATNAPETYTNGDQVLGTTSLGGAIRVVPVDEENASSISYYADDSGFTTLITLPNATLVPLISIQSNSAAFIFRIREVDGYGDGTQVKFVLIKNPQTLTGAAFTATGIPTGSHIKRDTTATAVTIGTGTVVWSGMGASAPAHSDQLMQALAAGTPGDTFTFAAQKFGTGTSKAFGSIRWSEQAAAL